MSSRVNRSNKHIPSETEYQSAMPRNPSIESSVSSVSSASQSYKSGASLPYRGTPDSAISPPDISSLISAAGSAENAVHGLWKEKQSASAHNSQLWRLVEKQRAMILGLNKDLERALKDKERYRKKLKEHLSHIPHLPNAVPRVDSALDRETSQSPALSDTVEDSQQQNTHQRSDTPSSPPRQATTGSTGTTERVRKSSISASSNDLSPHSLPVEQKHSDKAVKHENDISATAMNKAYPVKNDGLVPMHSIATQLSSVSPGLAPPSALPLPDSDKADDMQTMTVAPLNTKPKPLAASLVESTPIAEGLSPKSAVSEKASGLRKAPPKPLDLSKGAKVSAHLQDRRETDKGRSGSTGGEADDIIDTKELPTFERGRRKTREEDDMLRETILMQQEQEQEQQRSRSKKDKKSKSKSTSKAVEEFVPPKSPISDDNISPKTVLPRRHQQYDSGMASSPDSEPASIGAMIMGSAPDSGPLSPRRTDVPAPLISPGLPQSPRPINNRGSHVPQPRSPRQNLGSPTTGPWPNPTTRPLSPRAPREPIPAPPMSPLAMNSPHLARAEGYAIHISPPPTQQQKPQREPPDIDRGTQENQRTSRQPQTSQKPGNGFLQPSPPAHLSPDYDGRVSADSSDEKEHIYRGFVSEKYPNLLLSPNALPLIDVKVFSSRLRPSRWSFMAPDPQAEDPVFILAVTSRSEGKQLWRLEKTIVALPALDQQIKQRANFHGKLPDRGLFQGHAPAKIDGRRAALNSYFGELLETPMDEETAKIVCEFFSTDVVGAEEPDAIPVAAAAAAANSNASSSAFATSKTAASKVAKYHKEGFLTKRGKNFGGWKARYFVLDGPELRYYETSDGAHLGTIKLQSAQIGKQSQQSSSGSSPSRPKDDDPENQYRHAFLILEPKRKDSKSLVRHVLCAESDEERDAWVESLLQFVDPPTYENDGNNKKELATEGHKGQRSPHRPTSNKIRRERPRDNRDGRVDGRLTPEADKQDAQQAYSQDDTSHFNNPSSIPSTTMSQDEANSVSFPHHQHPTISGPTNGAPIQNAESWGNKTSAPSSYLGVPAYAKEKETKKRNIFGFRGKGSDHLTFQNGHSPPGLHHQQQTGGTMGYVGGNGSGTGQAHVIFGAPLNEAIAMVSPMVPCSGSAATSESQTYTHLPSVVYRCLEYLKAKDAASEEGIFRLSGSNIVIRNLRTRFNNEGDVRLLDEGQYYDIHAVASLLKLYLRELPVSVLTRDLHLDFLKVLEVDDKRKKVEAFNVLVHKLPRENLELLRALLGFLIEIIDKAEVNKMTARNVGIVFAPTLNIPGPLISHFLTDFPDIFAQAIADGEENEAYREITVNAPLTPDSIRSPRKQMFTDLPTPAYDQTNFHIGPGPGQAASLAPGLLAGRANGATLQQTRHSAYEPNFNPDQQQRPAHFNGQPQRLQAQHYGNDDARLLQQQNPTGPRYPSYHPPSLHDTGFIPLQPSYETPVMHQQQISRKMLSRSQQHSQQQHPPRHGYTYPHPHPQSARQPSPQQLRSIHQHQQQQQHRQQVPSDSATFGSLNGALAAQQDVKAI